jgi:cyanophycinase
MRNAVVILGLLLLPVRALAQGPLIVVGGGATVPEITAKALELGGGRTAVVAVLPQSSAEPDAGDASVKMWLDGGAAEAAKVSFTDPTRAAAFLKRATLIWIPGGDQNRVMKAIEWTGLDQVIRDRHRDGVAVGGTSAGAAVLAEYMFTGDADLTSLTSGATVTAKGLALWREALIDQHFVKRRRDNRLISAVFDHPNLVGVGIDESTAVIVRGTSFQVMGRSSVVVIDARRAGIEQAAPGTLVSDTGLILDVLRAGQSYSLAGR